jgi:hypothetical protein
MEKKELQLARLFHNTYERLAPEFGYMTREDTKEFDKNSPNGKLMIAVCKEVMIEELDKAREEGRKEAVDIMLEKYSDELDIAITEEGGWNYEYYLN